MCGVSILAEHPFVPQQIVATPHKPEYTGYKNPLYRSPGSLRQATGPDCETTRARGLAVDGSGNIYVAGFTKVALPGNVLTGTADYFLVKYDASGARQWTRQLGVAGAFTNGEDVIADSSGNVYVVGYTDNNLGGEILTGTLDAFISKYDATGARLWTKLLGTAGKTTFIRRVIVDSNDTPVVVGYSSGPLPGNTLTGSRDAYLARYDADGNSQWITQFGVAAVETLGFGITVDPWGNLHVTGYTRGGLDGNTLVGLQDMYLKSFDSTGAPR